MGINKYSKVQTEFQQLRNKQIYRIIILSSIKIFTILFFSFIRQITLQTILELKHITLIKKQQSTEQKMLFKKGPFYSSSHTKPIGRDLKFNSQDTKLRHGKKHYWNEEGMNQKYIGFLTSEQLGLAIDEFSMDSIQKRKIREKRLLSDQVPNQPNYFFPKKAILESSNPQYKQANAKPKKVIENNFNSCSKNQSPINKDPKIIPIEPITILQNEPFNNVQKSNFHKFSKYNISLSDRNRKNQSAKRIKSQVGDYHQNQYGNELIDFQKCNRKQRFNTLQDSRDIIDSLNDKQHTKFKKYENLPQRKKENGQNNNIQNYKSIQDEILKASHLRKLSHNRIQSGNVRLKLVPSHQHKASKIDRQLDNKQMRQFTYGQENKYQNRVNNPQDQYYLNNFSGDYKIHNVKKLNPITAQQIDFSQKKKTKQKMPQRLKTLGIQLDIDLTHNRLPSYDDFSRLDYGAFYHKKNMLKNLKTSAYLTRKSKKCESSPTYCNSINYPLPYYKNIYEK